MDFVAMKKKIKILISDTAPLYPPLWGGPKRIWNLYSSLSRDLFDFTYIGVSCFLGAEKKYSFHKIRDNFKEILCAFPQHYYPWHIFETKAFRHISLDLFAYLFMHTDWHFRYILNSLKADVIICSHPWASLSIEKKDGQFFIYDAHNCEYSLMSQILGKHPLKQFVLKRVKKIEAAACKKSDLILACSENEKKDFINLYNVDTDKIAIIPNGALLAKEEEEIKINYRNNLSIQSDDKIIIFLGAYYKPNIDAARFIIENIAIRLKELKFLIAGTAADNFKTKQIPSNVHLLGRIPDEQLSSLLRMCNIAINPMFSGSGVNIKMLDYMACGLPIVTTECGARGIETYNTHPFIISSPDKFIDNIKMITLDEELHKQMSLDGKRLISQYYSWDLISQKLQDIILEKLKYN
jgi:glycosyltransferase involved in cell wall biosynthesis